MDAAGRRNAARSPTNAVQVARWIAISDAGGWRRGMHEREKREAAQAVGAEVVSAVSEELAAAKAALVGFPGSPALEKKEADSAEGGESVTDRDENPMCEKCIHKAVCGKYAATGGHVGKCEHFREERRGRWIRRHNETKCSKCQFIYYSNRADYSYCPNCGADMWGGERDG